MSSFVSKIAKSRPHLIYLVRAKDATDRMAWYYILLEEGKVQAFEKAMKSANANLGDYGKVLESGYGDHPPEDIVKLMKDEYGFEA